MQDHCAWVYSGFGPPSIHSLSYQRILRSRMGPNFFFFFQGFYEPLVRLFYANLRSSSLGEIETLVLCKIIFLDSDIFDKIIDIHYSGFSLPKKSSWPSDFEVSFEDAKKVFISSPSGSCPSNLVPK